MYISAKFGSNLFCGFRKKEPEMFIGWFSTRFVFGADKKSNMAARVHNVFSLAEILKILSETTNQCTFLPSLVQICFVVSEKKMKM
jgi:hypothetical protein